jgi:hypothetical protein
MDTTRLASENLAPLVFDLSVKSEQVERALNSNYIDTSNLALYPTLTGCGVAVVGTGLLALVGLPVLVAGVIASAAGYYSGKLAKRYFQGFYVDSRIDLNKVLVGRILNQKDAATIAHVTSTIVTSHFGKEKWAHAYNSLRERNQIDDTQYLAAVFTFAPACWRLSAAKVYQLNAAANQAKVHAVGA